MCDHPDNSLLARLVKLSGLAVLLVGLATLSGCAAGASGASTIGFVTELDATNGLAVGSPVTYAGNTVGSVSDIGWKLNGDSKVSFDVQYEYAQKVHQDSIMVLRSDVGPPSLELYDPSPNGAIAMPGTKIDGVSTQRELAALLAARGFTSVASTMAGVAGALGSTPGASGAPPPAVTIDQLQRELAAIQAQAAANGSANTAATAAQLHALNQQMQSLKQQMTTLGASPQAQQLRNEIDQMARTLSTPPPPPSSGSTAVTPRVY